MSVLLTSGIRDTMSVSREYERDVNGASIFAIAPIWYSLALIMSVFEFSCAQEYLLCRVQIHSAVRYFYLKRLTFISSYALNHSFCLLIFQGPYRSTTIVPASVAG